MLNTCLQLENDVLDDDKLHGRALEKKLVREEGFFYGFEEWFSDFIANDPEYNFKKFDAENQQWVKDFRVREAVSSRPKEFPFD